MTYSIYLLSTLSDVRIEKDKIGDAHGEFSVK